MIYINSQVLFITKSQKSTTLHSGLNRRENVQNYILNYFYGILFYFIVLYFIEFFLIKKVSNLRRFSTLLDAF
jgi:hypothetical protein